MLLDIGNWGYQVGAVGIMTLTLAFLVSVRWWTDLLGRVLAAVFFSMSGILALGVIRLLNPDIGDTFFVWRAILFWGFGLGVWAGLAAFIWAQFFAPRMKIDRMTTRKEHYHEQEGSMGSDRSRRDGDSDDRAGVDC